MKKIIITKIFIVFLLLLIFGINTSFATIEDIQLKKEDFKKSELGVDAFSKLFNELNTDGNRTLNRVELEKATDRQIKQLVLMNSGSTDFGPSQAQLWRNSCDNINEEYQYRRVEIYGLEEDNDTHAGVSSGLTTTTGDQKYYSPENNGSISGSSGRSIDDAINDAENFVAKTDNSVKTVEESDLQNFSNSFYNILLTAGTAIAVIVGIIIGIQYMLGSVEQKADFKKLLIPYVVGCIVVFGSFGIWKMVIEIMANI